MFQHKRCSDDDGDSLVINENDMGEHILVGPSNNNKYTQKKETGEQIVSKGD